MSKTKVIWSVIKGLKPTPTKTDPDKLYHGTSGKNLASIKKHGLIPAGKSGKGATGSKVWHGSKSDMLGLVGLTDKTRAAAFYSSIVTRIKGRQVIIVVDKRKIDKKVLSRRKGSSVGGGKEWDYPKRIPPSAIIGYWEYKRGKGWKFRKKKRVAK